MRVFDTLPDIQDVSLRLKGKVNQIIKKIREDGAIKSLENQGKNRGLTVEDKILLLAGEHLSPPQQGALETIHDLQEKISLRQYETLRPFSLEPTSGLKLTQSIEPVSSVAIIGHASWEKQKPSLLMGPLIASEIAGVKKRWAFLTPDSNGGLSPLTLYGVGLGNPTKVYRGGSISALVALHEGDFGLIPEKVLLVWGDRLEKIAYKILFGAPLWDYDLVLLCDSDAPVNFIIDIFREWLLIDPYSQCAIITTSKTLLKKLNSLSPQEPIPSWWGDFQNISLVYAPKSETGINILGNKKVQAVVLIGQSFEDKSDLIKANHVFIGRYSDPSVIGISGSIMSLGGHGVLDFLKIKASYACSPQTYTRIHSYTKILGE